MSPDYTLVRISGKEARDWMLSLIDQPYHVAWDGENYWVRYQPSNDEAKQLAMGLPGVAFEIVDGNLLRRTGKVVPEAVLPSLDWTLVADHIDVSSPIAACSANRSCIERVSLALVRDQQELPSTACIVSLKDLLDWAELAPAWRLAKLRYAIRGKQALVLGDPLPPILTRYFVARGSILVPAGMTWSPWVDPSGVAKIFQMPEQAWLCWESNRRWSIVHEFDLVALSRSSLRQIETLKVDQAR